MVACAARHSSDAFGSEPPRAPKPASNSAAARRLERERSAARAQYSTASSCEKFSRQEPRRQMNETSTNLVSVRADPRSPQRDRYVRPCRPWQTQLRSLCELVPVSIHAATGSGCRIRPPGQRKSNVRRFWRLRRSCDRSRISRPSDMAAGIQLVPPAADERQAILFGRARQPSPPPELMTA